MKIYTYYEDVSDGKYSNTDNEKLLELWKKNWKGWGWTPVVLTRDDAKENPRYEEYLSKFSSFPTVNSQHYEIACFMRWVAMEMIGGWHCDFDVMNYGLMIFTGRCPKLTLFSGSPTPCLVWGEKAHYTRMLELFMNYIPTENTNHVSDQSILKEYFLTDEYQVFPICKEVGNEGVYEAIHYPNGAMIKAGYTPRYKFIEFYHTLIGKP